MDRVDYMMTRLFFFIAIIFTSATEVVLVAFFVFFLLIIPDFGHFHLLISNGYSY